MAGMTFRVFVSSTFSDLKAERDALQKKVFPKLKKLCEDNGCSFQAIDLRWGVAQEASLGQKTMKICLGELKRCQEMTPKPNFIVLLGDRYGWRPLPAEIDASEFEKVINHVGQENRELVDKCYKRDDNAVPPVYILQPVKEEEKESWYEDEKNLHPILLDTARKAGLLDSALFKYRKSATEQEIEAGALSVEDASDHVFCFFRNIEGLPLAESASDFVDLGEDSNPDKEARGMLGDLKGCLKSKLGDNVFDDYKATWQIEDTDHPLTEDHLDKLCADVYDSLSKVIEAEMERLESIDELEREIVEQESFAEERRCFFAGRATMLKTINDYVQEDDPHPFAIWGEGGCGKSALLAYAAKQIRDSLPQALVISRFIGATPASFDVRALLESLCRQIARFYNDDADTVPSTYEDLIADFPKRIALATGERPLMMFIDSLDQLSETHNAANLTWFPASFPEHVHMVLSTRPGKELVALRKKLPEGSVQKLGAMLSNEGSEVLDLRLRNVGRTLKESQKRELIEQFALNGNPLYLKLAFEEARLWHSYSEDKSLNTTVDGTINDLYERLSLEKNHGKLLTGRSLGYIVASRYGLSEEELIDILSLDRDVIDDFSRRSPESPKVDKLPFIVWSRLYEELKPYLGHKSAQDVSVMTFYHRELGDVASKKYLGNGDGGKHHLAIADYFLDKDLNDRKISELPWQLAQAEAWQRLYDLLSNLDFLNASWEACEYDVKAYWAKIEENSQYRMVDAYQPVLDEPDMYSEECVFCLATLLSNTGHPLESFSLRKYLVEHYGKTGDKGGLAASLAGQANILYAQGNLDGAMELYKEQERICSELGDKGGFSTSLGNQATILMDHGDLDGAMDLRKEEEKICRELENTVGLQHSLGNQGLILRVNGNLDGAMELYKEQERICRELGNKDELGASLNNQALILKAQGNLDGAMELHKEVERICRELGNKNGLQGSLGNQAIILADQGDLEGAMKLHKEEEKICRELGNKDELGASLNNQALILKAQGNLDGAMELHKEVGRICRELGNKNGLQGSLGNQAIILADQGDLEGAMKLYRHQEVICRELGNKDGLGNSIGGQALILHKYGNLEKALELYKEQEKICRELGNKDGLQTAMGNQGLVLRARGDLNGAMKLHREKEKICRELGNKDGLSTSLGNQANILQDGGDLDGAMELYKEQERICRELGNIEGLAPALANQALNLNKMGKSTDALALAQEAYDIAKDHGLTALAQQIKPILDSISY